MAVRCYDCAAKNRWNNANCWNCKKSLEKGTGFKRWCYGTRSIYFMGIIRKSVISLKDLKESKESKS